MDFDSMQQKVSISGMPFLQDKVTIMGVPFYAGSLEALVHHLIDLAKSEKNNQCIHPADAHVLVHADKDPSYKNLLRNSYLNLPDGMPIVWLGRLMGFKKMKRCYGPDLFKMMMMSSAQKPVRHFLCGGKEGIAVALKEICSKRFGNEQIVGTYIPPFREMTDAEMKELGEMILAAQADIVWIGLGAPKQEKFAHRLSSFTKTSLLITVGAAFDFHTNQVKQAPRWMQRSGMEWFFRMMMEPKRLGKRYALVIPKFLQLAIRQLFQ
jgi:N-acetylglucosaminyldiphosphoundecaprenol N-acetyl-beta-D-mannosaminyltransferase